MLTHEPKREVLLQATLAASAIALTRPDAILLAAPTLLVLLHASRRAQPWMKFITGLLPLAAWGVFSLVYYGFVWPNTAYAKLGSGIAASDLAWQGVRYLRESLRNDPLTLLLTVAALLLAVRRAATRIERAFAVGNALYLMWVVKVGGDFMSGRFLVAPLFLAVILLAIENFGSGAGRLLLVSITLLCGAFAPSATWRIGPLARAAAPAVDSYGLANERDFYLDATGLAARLRSGPSIALDVRVEALALRAQGPALIYLSTLGSGIFGYYAGPKIHIVDAWALGDALLARLPAIRQVNWRIGHFTRLAPPGYLKTLASGHNRIRDPGLAKYWDKLALVIRGPSFSWPRAGAIADFALGRADRLIDRERFPLADLVNADAPRFAGSLPDGVQFGDGGLDLHFEKASRAEQLDLVLCSSRSSCGVTPSRSASSLRWRNCRCVAREHDAIVLLDQFVNGVRFVMERWRLVVDRNEWQSPKMWALASGCESATTLTTNRFRWIIVTCASR